MAARRDAQVESSGVFRELRRTYVAWDESVKLADTFRPRMRVASASRSSSSLRFAAMSSQTLVAAAELRNSLMDSNAPSPIATNPSGAAE